MAGCNGGKKAENHTHDTGLKELKTEDTVVGMGLEAKTGDTAYVLYRGTFLSDGKQFDANMDDVESKMPFSFPIGAGAVIKGWDEGVVGMKEGGTRIISVPYELAYGASGSESIPPRADLKFEVKLLFLGRTNDDGRYDFNDDKVGSGPAAKIGDKVEINYVGTYLTGKQWDSSYERGKTVTFPLEITNECMPGLIYGIEGMKAGGKRTLVLSPSMAFGMGGTEVVQGNQPVKIVVELVSVNGAGA